MTKKVKLFEDYIKNKLESYEALHLWPPEGIVIFKNSVEKMLNDLALKQAELEEKIDFILENKSSDQYHELSDNLSSQGFLPTRMTLKELYEENLKNKNKGDK